jgi:hypothetical protein
MTKRSSKRSAERAGFKLETLETRQLLATIVGGTGTEVGSNITVDGKVYDQVLMTGSAVTVRADAGQIVRVDFMDVDGDILRAEYSGAGTLTVSLANFVDAALPSRYNISTTKYVSGLASFNISGEDATSNFLVTSLGPVTAFNGLANPIFAGGTLTGGNNIANVSKIQLFGDGTTVTGSEMGSIFAGNAVFSDSTGTTGIIAPIVNFGAGSKVTIGDIVPTGSARPYLQIGAFSTMNTVTVAGGSFPDGPVGYTGAGYLDSSFGTNVSTIVSTTGTNSKGTVLPPRAIANNPTGAAILYNTAGLATTVIDGSTATTASLDALYKNIFLGDVVINNGLAAGVVFRALQFGNITVNGDLAGVITTDINNDNFSGTNEQSIGNVTIAGSVLEGGYIESATTIGSINVAGTATHTLVAPSVAVGTITAPLALGMFTTLGRVGASATIGDITVGGAINDSAAEAVIVSDRGQTASLTGIGTITAGGLTSNAGASQLPIIGSLGSSISTSNGIAGLAIGGALSLTGGAGGIVSDGSIGVIGASSLTLNTNASNGIVAASSGGSIGNITLTGGGMTVTSGQITAGGSIGDISLAFGNMTIGQAISAGKNIGNILAGGGNLTTTAPITAGGSGTGNIGSITVRGGNVSIDHNITATGGNIGAILVNGGLSTAVVGVTRSATIQATIDSATQTGGAIGGITVNTTGTSPGSLTFGTSTFTGAVLGKTVGNVTVSGGDLTFTNVGSQILATTTASDPWAGTSIGDVTVTGGGITGVGGNVEFQANKIGNVTVTGRATTPTLLTNVIFSAKGTTGAAIATAKIGNITLDNTANNAGDIAAATTASDVATDATHGTGFSSSGNLGNVTIKAGSVKTGTSSTSAEIVSGANAWGSLVFRAGTSNLGGLTTGTAAALVAGGTAVNTANGAAAGSNIEGVAIGDVTITANVSAGSNLAIGNAPGTGLIVASGINTAVAGGFRDAAGVAAGNPAQFPTSLTLGTIGNVVINDSTGGVVRTPFNTSGLDVTTQTDKGGSIIIGESIASITVNSGAGAILSLPGLSGIGLKGALGSTVAIPSTASQQFVGSNTGSADSLVIVVL